MKLEFEVKAFGAVEVAGAEDAFKGIELSRVHTLSKDTTLGEVEEMLRSFFADAEKDYAQPDSCAGKITIRVKKEENGDLTYLG